MMIIVLPSIQCWVLSNSSTLVNVDLVVAVFRSLPLMVVIMVKEHQPVLPTSGE